MRKIVIIIIIFLFSNFENYAQENKKFSFQFDIGTSITIPYKSTIEFQTLLPINGSYKTNYKIDYGYFAEILSSYNKNEKISVTTGLNYNYISYRINDGEGIITSKGNLNNSYLNIPLLLNYRLSENTPISISAGTYFGLLLFAQEKGTSYLDTSNLIFADPNDPLLQPEQDYENNIAEDYYSVDYGVLLQLEYEFSLKEKISGVILSRFNYGLKNVLSSGIDKSKTMHSAAYEWKNYNILIGIGIKIR